MLKIDVPDRELFNEETGEFFVLKGQSLVLEHSLVSLSKWESLWKIPFLSKEIKTRKQLQSYIECMTITQNVNKNIYKFIGQETIRLVNAYIEDPMTATTFSKRQDQRINREVITAEIIYYWMVAFNIPFECEKWHINRLLVLINVCNLKSQPNKKMSRQEIIARNKALNASRRKALGTKG